MTVSVLTARVVAVEMGGDLTARDAETGGPECMWCELLLPLLEWPTALIPARGFPKVPKPASRPRLMLPNADVEGDVDSFNGLVRS